MKASGIPGAFFIPKPAQLKKTINFQLRIRTKITETQRMRKISIFAAVLKKNNRSGGQQLVSCRLSRRTFLIKPSSERKLKVAKKH